MLSLRLFASRNRTSMAYLAMIVAASLSAGCKQNQAGPPGGMPPPEVVVVTVGPKAVPVSFEYPAQTAGSREVEVRARTTGIILKRNFQEGAVVKAGQSLFTLDPAPARVALAKAEADLAVAQARLAQARRDAERLKPLLPAKAVSQKEFDDATSAAAIASADVQAAQARVREARLNLDYTRVESPISGVASRALLSEGSLVSGPDVLLTTVTQSNPIYVLFGISDSEHAKLRRDIDAGRIVLPADKRFIVSVKLADGTLYEHSAKLDFSDIRVGTATASSEARAEIPNPAGILRPGQFVRAVLSGAQRPRAILVPQRAVLDGPQGKFVLLVGPDSKVQPRPVQPGDWSGEQWVIDGGLSGGERVIVDGMLKAAPGSLVKIADSKPVAAAPAAH